MNVYSVSYSISHSISARYDVREDTVIANSMIDAANTLMKQYPDCIIREIKLDAEEVTFSDSFSKEKK